MNPKENVKQSDLVPSLIAPSLYSFVVDDSSSSSTYSVDKLRLRIDSPDTDESFNALQKSIDTWTLPSSIDTWSERKTGRYRDMYSLEFEREDTSIVIGLAHMTGKGKINKGHGFIEFNPNKLYKEGLALIRRLLNNQGLRLSVVRYDLAIDYPIARDTVRTVKDGRRYEFISSDSITEYLGQQSKNGRVKVYDKQAESKLDRTMTRVELTCSGEWDTEQILAHLPRVFTFAGNDFEGLQKNTKQLAIAFQALMVKGDSLEQWLAGLDPRTKTKLRNAFASQVAFAYNADCVNQVKQMALDLSQGLAHYQSRSESDFDSAQIEIWTKSDNNSEVFSANENLMFA